MLVRFSAQNYRSIGETPITLNMVSSSKIRDHVNHVVSFDSAKILRDAVIYGANAAGKSNLIRALEYLVKSLANGFLAGGAEASYCRNIEDGAQKETAFDVQFEIDGDFFDYGFSCNLAEGAVEEEWLYRLESTGSGKGMTLFDRKASCINADLPEDVNDKARQRLSVYIDDFQSDTERNPNKLFLASLNHGREFDDESGLGFFSSAYKWLTQNIVILNPGSYDRSSFMFYLNDLDRAGRLLATFDTGISSLDKHDIPFEDLERYLPPEAMGILRTTLENDPNCRAVTIRGGDVLAGIVRKKGHDPETTILKIRHEGSSSLFDFGDESAGTKRLLDILDMLLTNDDDTVFVIDELSRGLHPLLTKHFVDLFNEVHADDECQLVFTTHENDVMSFDHFRRDEVWFIERNEAGTSSLYPLDDFVVRSDARIGKSYMEGRYGGIPVLSMQNSMDALGCEADAVAEGFPEDEPSIAAKTATHAQTPRSADR